MDKLLTSLIDLVEAADFHALEPADVDAVVRHTIDTIGCGAGGFASAPATRSREVTRGTGGALTASVYGEPAKVLVDQAAFANTTADRYLDFNDFGISGHPSDMIPALFAMAEAAGGSGADLVTSIHLAYEIATHLAEAVPADGGWDQGLYCSLGIAAGQAKLLRLPPEQIGHALSLAVVPSIPLRVTRFGELSEWKAAATAHAAMTATFAVRLAAAGMTGPPDPFEGKDGLLERVWPTFEPASARVSTSAIRRASLKRHPACYWAQVPIDLALALREQVRLTDVVSIEVETCVNAWRSIGGGRGDAAEKWRPPTRETADHSMPFLMGVALIDGQISDVAFTDERLTDRTLLSIVDRISVIERADLSVRAGRDGCPTAVTVTLADGTIASAEADVPRGHPDNPMSDAEVMTKFETLASRALSPTHARALSSLLSGLPELSTVDEIAAIFRDFAAP
ncbi:MmgE/PrpD family protein [Rhodococcus rhodochrous]|uniref:MmgE/PrpD family protein n=1 Tax=Rhodococcus rhodochrous TaxID=1829 RepID=UPI0002FC98E3|nr:MmgE/PrpD family protein [Rhodococcus rhodochrous]